MSDNRLAVRRLGRAIVCCAAVWLAIAGLLGHPARSRAAGNGEAVRLVDFKVLPSAGSVAAGRVRFTVRNAADMEHELVIIRTGRRAASLPVHGSRASEAGKVGAVEVPMGKTRSVTVRLARGHYALICNEPGHYRLGMHADLTVK
jgi:uncharacterized cupredoxin-like copper-binding protein